MVIGQVLSAVVVAVLLVAVAVGWAMRGAMEVRQYLTPPRQRRRLAAVRPAILNLVSNRTLIFVTAFLLALALFFFARFMDRALPVLGAVVLSFAYALLCAMVTGFTVWMRIQREQDDGAARTGPESFRWAAWVGVGLGTAAVAYLVVDVITNLTS